MWTKGIVRMKPKLAFAWFLVSVALAAILVVQWRTKNQQQIKLEKLQLQVEKLDQQEKTVRAEKAELEKQAQQLRSELRAAELEVSNARQAAAAGSKTNAPGKASAAKAPGGQEEGGGMAGMLSKMMSDPEMRKAIEQQQRMGMDMIYGSLFKHLQLSPEQERKFKDALLEMQMSAVSQAGSMFGGTNRTEAMQKVAEERKKSEEKIKEILGEEKYAQYQDYNATIQERMVLDQFSKQSDLSPEQGEQLLAIMREEKQRVQLNMQQNTDPAEAMKMLESEQAMEEMFKKLDTVNESVLDRAKGILTPEQMEKFRPFVTNQSAMQRAGMQMARKMMQQQNAQAATPR